MVKRVENHRLSRIILQGSLGNDAELATMKTLISGYAIVAYRTFLSLMKYRASVSFKTKLKLSGSRTY
jgi:hypothetical protein